MCDVELPFPGLFPLPEFIQELQRDLILGLTFANLFPYPIKASEGNNNKKHRLSGLNDAQYVQTPFLT